jgi:hypothetical protein
MKMDFIATQMIEKLNNGIEFKDEKHAKTKASTKQLH